MKYTKSELREAKNRIDDILYKLNDKLPYVRTKDGWNWMYHKLVGDNLEELNQVLAPLKTHIIDNDDYSLAVEMNDKVTPVWKEYCKRANRGEFDVRQDPYPDDVKIEDGFLTNEREIHSEAIPVQVTISDLRAWIREQEPNPSQPNPTAETFFEAFRSFAHDCIVFIGFKYRTRKEKPQNKPGDIVGQMEAYKKTVAISDLMKEIQNHIDNCQSTLETESYISSLLLPFKELCEVLRPPIMNEETRLFIDLLCYSAINHEKEKPGTIEYCLRSLMNDMDKYSFELYNVLIQNSIDLNEYQQKTGVYFRREWNPANSLFFKFGDLELIDSLQQEEEVEIQEGVEVQEEEITFKPLSDGFNTYMFGLYSSMCDEKIIENIDFVDFVKFISQAHFGSMFTVARANRNQNKLFLIVKHMKTWFSEEWAEKVAFSMGTTVERIDKVSPNEIRKSNKEWVDSLDKICPKRHSVQ